MTPPTTVRSIGIPPGTAIHAAMPLKSQGSISPAASAASRKLLTASRRAWRAASGSASRVSGERCARVRTWATNSRSGSRPSSTASVRRWSFSCNW